MQAQQQFLQHLRSVAKKVDLYMGKPFSPDHTTNEMMMSVVQAGLMNVRERCNMEGGLIFNCQTLQLHGINIDFNFI